MYLQTLSHLPLEQLALQPSSDPRWSQLGESQGSNLVPIYLQLPPLFSNGDYRYQEPYHELLLTCISHEDEDLISPDLQALEDQVSDLIPEPNQKIHQREFKSILQEVSTQNPFYRFGVLKLRFRSSRVYDAQAQEVFGDEQQALLGLPGYIQPLLKLTGVWFSTHHYGLSWEVVQLQRQEGPLPGLNYLTPPESEEEYEEQYGGYQVADQGPLPDYLMTDDSEDEGYEYDESEPNSFTSTESYE